MKKAFVAGCAACLALLFCGCYRDQGTVITRTPPPSPSPTAEPTPEPVDEVAAYLEGLTPEQKVGQLFVVRPDALDPNQTQAQINDVNGAGVTAFTEEMRQMLEQYPVGGVCQFSKNITDPEQLRQFNTDLQAASAVPLLIAVDEEGGMVSRLAGNPAFDVARFESPSAVGSTGDPEAARAMGATIGAYLKEYGFNVDFAPVADVNTNPDNPVIGERAFSGDPQTAAAMAAAMAEGLQSVGILPVYKHFPGHGDTAEDSHTGLAVVHKNREELRACEWVPYLGGGIPAVMAGHIALPQVTEDETPAALSYQLITEILRGELGHTGLVITDSLAMGAVTDSYDPATAAILAVQAGCDVLLMPDGLAEAYEGVLAAVQNGTITEERLNESVYRILQYKKSVAGL